MELGAYHSLYINSVVNMLGIWHLATCTYTRVQIKLKFMKYYNLFIYNFLTFSFGRCLLYVRLLPGFSSSCVFCFYLFIIIIYFSSTLVAPSFDLSQISCQKFILQYWEDKRYRKISFNKHFSVILCVMYCHFAQHKVQKLYKMSIIIHCPTYPMIPMCQLQGIRQSGTK